MKQKITIGFNAKYGQKNGLKTVEVKEENQISIFCHNDELAKKLIKTMLRDFTHIAIAFNFPPYFEGKGLKK